MAWCALVVALMFGMAHGFVGLSHLASAAPAAHVPAAETAMAQGWSAWQRGAFEEAVRSWQDAAQRYAQAGQQRAQSVALTQLARAYQALGQYRKASQNLSSALELARKSGDRVQVATVLGSLGGTYFVSGSLDAAQQALQEGLRLAREIGNTALMASLLNDLGNVFTSQNKYAEALDAYGESVRVAEQHDRALAVRALTNAAMASIQQEQYQTARTRLDLAWAQMPNVLPSHDKASSFINIGLAYASLSASLSEDETQLTLRAAEALNAAAHLARTINDQRALSYALGHLGGLYEEEGRYHEALQLTRQALFAAQQVQAPESLYRWQWQTGRLLKALGELDTAITSYRHAVDTLQSFRQEMVAGSGSSRTSFRQIIGPVYFGLVDLLLQRAAALPDRAQYEPLLVEARDAVELFKAVELRDYFKDDCVDAARQRVVNLESVAQSAITIYPILLPERTELLLSLPDGLRRVTVPVTAERLTQEVRELRRLLEKVTTREYLPHAQQLYDWLIRPLAPALASTPIDTLVFVPDGPLRTIPMAALHDGQQFLIQKYAIATTPGLKLTDPRPLPRGNMQMLALGLTEAVQGFSALPYVSSEMAALQQLYGAEVLLNQRFLLPSVDKELQEKPFSIVHIASHGQFDSDVTKTFVLTFDDKLTMDHLEQTVGRLRFRENALELLTLSACQTAAGDDRAALGLAGVAIKAGARSALATLWFIDDEASSELITEFYRQFQDPAISRAKALQRAQGKLLSNWRYEHPGYWAPFLLLNNWL
jgi:CHAT domain-containing protein/Tfp pilus assembly protein PilF